MMVWAWADVRDQGEVDDTKLPLVRSWVPPGTGVAVAVGTGVVGVEVAVGAGVRVGVAVGGTGVAVGLAVPPARSRATLYRSGLPRPVTASQPVPALYAPLVPEVMSWNGAYACVWLARLYSLGSKKPTDVPWAARYWLRTAVMPAHSGLARLVPPNCPQDALLP